MTITPSTRRSRLDFADWPIRFKLLLALLLAAIIPATALLLVNSWVNYQANVNTTAQSLQRTSQIAASLFDETINRLNGSLRTTANDATLHAFVSRHFRVVQQGISSPFAVPDEFVSRSETALSNHMAERRGYRAMRILTPDGLLLAYAGDIADIPRVTATIQRTHPTYEQIQARDLPPDAPTLLDPYADPDTGILVVEAVIPLEEFNTLQGYIIITLWPDVVFEEALSSMRQEVEAAPDEAEAAAGGPDFAETLYVTNADGWLLTEAQGAAPFTQQLSLLPETVSDPLPDRGPTTTGRDWGDGPIDVIGRYTRMASTGWYAVAEAPSAVVGLPILFSVLAASVPAFFITVALSALLIYLLNQRLVGPLVRLTDTAQDIAGGNITRELPRTSRRDEVGTLSNAIATMTESLRSAIQDLEGRVGTRTRDLELTTTIGLEAASLVEIDRLLNDTVNRIVAEFPLIYHAQVFLLDDAGEYANLVASTGQPGQDLLRRGHRLAVGSVSVIGRVTELAETVIARDTSTSRVHRKNEFLPETRAEMALPLLREGRVIGALDVQSKQSDAFTPDEQAVFETLAAQIAIAIDNARRFEQMQRRATEMENITRLLTRSAWEQALLSGRSGALEAVAGAADTAEAGQSAGGWSQWQAQAARERRMIISPALEDNTQVMAVPILVRGEVLGVIEWRLPPGQVTENAKQMARDLVSRLAVTLETIRLLERSEQQAERERLVNQITGKLTAEPNVDLILQTAVRELAEVLNTSRVDIQLKPANGTPEPEPTERA